LGHSAEDSKLSTMAHQFQKHYTRDEARALRPEIRAWLKEASAAGGDLVDSSLFEEFSISDLSAMTSLNAADIDALQPSEVRQVSAVAKEVNADFFAMRSRLVALGRQIVAGA